MYPPPYVPKHTHPPLLCVRARRPKTAAVVQMDLNTREWIPMPGATLGVNPDDIVDVSVSGDKLHIVGEWYGVAGTTSHMVFDLVTGAIDPIGWCTQDPPEPSSPGNPDDQIESSLVSADGTLFYSFGRFRWSVGCYDVCC